LNLEILYTLQEAKVLIERWRKEYNTIRPHRSLGYRPPAPEAARLFSPGSAPLHPV
jgi:putative transposase